jgi:hypothetical protein
LKILHDSKEEGGVQIALHHRQHISGEQTFSKPKGRRASACIIVGTRPHHPAQTMLEAYEARWRNSCFDEGRDFERALDDWGLDRESPDDRSTGQVLSKDQSEIVQEIF